MQENSVVVPPIHVTASSINFCDNICHLKEQHTTVTFTCVNLHIVTTVKNTNLLWPVEKHLNNKIPPFLMIEEDKETPMNKPCSLM
jgi:hypothetical protein